MAFLLAVTIGVIWAGAGLSEEAKTHRLTPVSIDQVKIDDTFWTPKLRKWQEVMIADCFRKFENDRGGAVNNFDKVRDGNSGNHGGCPWYDGLIYEMIRATADFHVSRPDPENVKRIEGYIARIAAAQARSPDGYLNTYTQLMRPTQRWGMNGGDDNWQHDMYNAGAMFEAAVHWYRATGRTDLLQVAVKMANCACDVMGPPPKKNAVPGHSIGEEALVKLYLLFREQPELKQKLSVPVDENRYLKLAEFWIENRGNHAGRKSFQSYGQDHKPVLAQETIEGHSVRATLLCTGVVAAAMADGRADYLRAASRLWENMVHKRMHISGCVGTVAEYEGFGADYILPNNAYLETCAAVGAGFFHYNMGLALADAKYFDELERVLFNGVLSGTSLSGDHYFYENPLESGPDRARWAWHGCPCCPPMFLKIMGALPGYIYSRDEAGIYVNLYLGNQATIPVGAQEVTLRQATCYPWSGRVKLSVECQQPAEFDLNLRIPGWCRQSEGADPLYSFADSGKLDPVSLKINGQPVADLAIRKGYARLRRQWRQGDTVELDFPMPARRVKANPKVAADVGRVALVRGPIVYCLEAADHSGQVRHITLPPDAKLSPEYHTDLLGGVMVLRGTAQGAYRTKAGKVEQKPVELLAIPYYANANRQPGEMLVWVPEKPELAQPLPAAEASLRVHTGDVSNGVSRYMTGACLEDVNHEVYGGIYSQMIFGESFQEPSLESDQPLKGFAAYGGSWKVEGDVLEAGPGDGPKLVAKAPELLNGEVGVEVFFADAAPGNAGLILRVAEPGPGADKFLGYEVSLEPSGKIVRLGRHRNNWEHFRDAPCEVPVGQWIPLVVKLEDKRLEIRVGGKLVLQHTDEQSLKAGLVGLRPWLRGAKFRNLWVRSAGKLQKIAFEPTPRDPAQEVSRMWRPVRQGMAKGAFGLETQNALVCKQSQTVTFVEGSGEIGIENRGLNRWGMNFQAGKPYQGFLWVRAEKPTEFFVSADSADGATQLAECRLHADKGDWQRVEFSLTPSRTVDAGRFSIKLKQKSSLAIGHVFLQPGPWGRYKGLPVRKDVADMLVAQGLTVLRYGGSMVNAPEYRWKKMIGPRDRRPPYRGTWYQWSSNGWGIVDFLNFCEAAGLLAIPAFNMGESPQDMADFIEYVNGPADSPWGRKRVEDGHPAPYRLKYVELGNEEAVNDEYFQRFQPMAEAIWAKDPEMTIVVGDFLYAEPIADPFNFRGAPNITSLAAHKKILELAKNHSREVWFDVHVSTDFPRDWQGLRGVSTFIDALGQICPGAKYKVPVFELNAGNHAMRRALANARATGELMRMGGHVPIVCSANCLQPLGQNDNGWDQGLLFLTPSQVWGQPPYYVTQMISRNYQPKCVKADVQSPGNALDVTATRSEDGKTLVLQVVNLEDRDIAATLELKDFMPQRATANLVQLRGKLDGINTPQEPQAIVSWPQTWRHGLQAGPGYYVFPKSSFTVFRFE